MHARSGREYRKDGKVVWRGDLGDVAFRQSANSIFGEHFVTERINHVVEQFQFAIAPARFRSIVGQVSQQNSMAIIATGTQSFENGVLTTRAVSPYSPGQDSVVLFTATFTEGAGEGTYQRYGLFTDSGYYVGFEGNLFGVTLKDEHSDDIFVPQSEFNLDKLDGTGQSGFNLVHRNMNIYRLNFGWLGIAPVIWEIYGGFDTGWIPFHVFDLTNQIESVHSGNPSLPISIEVYNADTAQNVEIKTGSMNASMGSHVGNIAGNRYSSIGRTIELNTTLTNIMTLRNPASYKGKVNTVLGDALYFSALTDGAQSVRIMLLFGATLQDSQTFEFVDEENDALMVAYDGGAVVDEGKVVFAFGAPPTGHSSENVVDLLLRLAPGEEVVIAGMTRGGSNNVRLDMSYVSRF